VTWILAGATVMVLSAIAVAYRRADRDRCRAAHPTARRVVYPLLVAANGDAHGGPALPRCRERHLVIVRSRTGEVSARG
jgi:hypothetical protein